VIGVLIMGIVKDVMDLMNLATFWQLVAMGLILLAAVMFDKLRQKKSV
jgi:ribose/xylose/arabinose/galactoside ABC-type transport system permease subunit